MGYHWQQQGGWGYGNNSWGRNHNYQQGRQRKEVERAAAIQAARASILTSDGHHPAVDQRAMDEDFSSGPSDKKLPRLGIGRRTAMTWPTIFAP